LDKVIDFKEWINQNFDVFEKSLNGEKLNGLHTTRKEALKKFNELSLPTLKDEEWRYTNISPLLKYNFNVVTEQRKVSNEVVKKLLFDEMDAHHLVFVNGQYSAENSKLYDLPKGVIIQSIQEAIKNQPGQIQKYFSKYANHQDQVFTALNTAFMKDGAFIYVPDSNIIERPIHIIFITSVDGDKIITQPRNLFIAGKNSQVTIIEHYASEVDEIYFTNTTTEIVADENAIVDHIKLQEESGEAFHIGRMEIDQERNSNFTSHSISRGGKITRNDFNSRFNGEGGECMLNGLFITEDNQLFDTHTIIDHATPYCNSHEHYKGILNGKSSGVFNGKVIVREDAQKTNAFQENNNILLSDEAVVNTKPQLEIFADDVKCSHGATIGQLNDEAKFYLKARGIGNEMAKAMLIHAFAFDVVTSIKSELIKNYVEDFLSKRFIQES
jgi:Fe-S cluster assembly protein SufD